MPVVVGTVSTREGRAAIRRAAEEAVLRSTSLVVVPSTRPAADDPDAELLRQRVAEASGVVADAGQQVVHVPSPGTGDVADDLVTVATEHDADCIVIGLRRRSPVGKLILGANVQRILLDAPCPVIAVKADSTD